MKKPRLTSSSRAQLPEFRTERKRTEEARAESLATLQALFDNALDAILLVDDEARYVDANPAACALLGYSREELLRMTVWDITPPPNYELCHELWNAFIAAGSQSGEYTLRRKDGTSIDAGYRAVSTIRPGLHLFILHDITERQRAQTTLDAIVIGTASSVGPEFFPSLVRHLASALDVQYALVTYFVEGPHKLKTLGYWAGGEAQPNIEYLIAGTPCEIVVKKGVPCFYPSQLQQLFPEDKDLVAMNAESYLGVPLLDPAGTPLGGLCILDTKPFRDEKTVLSLLQVFAARAASELVRIRAEEVLRLSEHNYRELIEQASDGIFIADLRGNYLIVNQSACALLGYSKEELLSMNIADLISQEELQRAPLRLDELRQGKAIISERALKRKNGTTIQTEISAKMLSDGRLQANVRDITERKQAEQKLKESREQLRMLSGYLQKIREDERKRIAREIHDELGQELTALKMEVALFVKSLLERAHQPHRSDYREKLESFTGIVDTAIRTVRRIATELRPDVLDKLGLVDALRWQAEEFGKRTGIRCDFEAATNEKEFAEDLSTTVFRIFQESLTNVARHSGATVANASLSIAKDRLQLTITDNGRGITDKEITTTSSLGLLGIRERALLMGGTCTVAGAPGKGTTITVELPLTKLAMLDSY